jgi:competence protein ComGC
MLKNIFLVMKFIRKFIAYFFISFGLIFLVIPIYIIIKVLNLTIKKEHKNDKAKPISESFESLS